MSFWQGTEIDWDLLCAEVDGFIFRSTYGIWQDTLFDWYYEEATKRGKPVGAYHYIIGNYSPLEQAYAFQKSIADKNLKLGIHPDVEDTRVGTALTRKVVDSYIENISMIIAPAKSIYTGKYAWKTIMGDVSYADYDLWVANYGVSTPALPYGWTDWKLWQYTSSGYLNGFKDRLDLNYFAGSKEDFALWIGEEFNTPEILEVPEFSQKDARWASEKLGTSPVTIGGYGCLITALASVLRYFGKPTDPSIVNKDLMRVDGYLNGNLLVFDVVKKIYPDIVVDWDNFMSDEQSVSLPKIDALLSNEIPVIVHVDYKPDTTAIDMHWVTIVGKVDNDYIIIDPIDGATVRMSDRYGNKIYRAVVYKGVTMNEKPLYKVEVICSGLNIRSGASTNYPRLRTVLKGTQLDVYEEVGLWLRVGQGEYCSGNSMYVKKVEISDKEKLDLLWAAHPELH